jgi:hypothetical protein
MGDRASAHQHLAAAVAADPMEPQAYLLAGAWRLQAGDATGALKAWQWGRQFGLPDPRLLAGLARLYDTLGQPGEARACWRDLLTIQPGHADGFKGFWRDLQRAPWEQQHGPGEQRDALPSHAAKA